MNTSSQLYILYIVGLLSDSIYGFFNNIVCDLAAFLLFKKKYIYNTILMLCLLNHTQEQLIP